MNIDIKLPSLGSTMTEGKITKMYLKVGSIIKYGDVMFEVSTGKVNNKIHSEYEGVVKDVIYKEGSSVKVGEVVAVIDGQKVQNKENITQNTSSSNVSNNYFNISMKKKERKIDTKIAVIGGGPGGYVAAIKAAQLGAKVVLIEKDKVGGVCLNRGCIPTKALSRSSEVLGIVKRAKEFGINVESFIPVYKSAVERKNMVVNRLVKGVEFLLKQNNVEIIYGEASFENKNTIKVLNSTEDVTINAENIIIATGSRPAKLPIEGFDNDNVLNSDDILNLEELPNKMVIIGGGVIGMEFAFILKQFGVGITIVEMMPEILPNVDAEVSKVIKRNAQKQGIKFYTSSKVEKIVKEESGGLIVIADVKGVKKSIYADKVFVSIGRSLNTDIKGIEKLDLELDKKAIKIDNHMMTSQTGIYAIGDVTGKMMLAHVASAQGIAASMNIMDHELEIDYTKIPAAIFTHPEVGYIGLSEDEAKQKYNIKIGRFPFSANGKALTLGETDGFVKIIVDRDTDNIVGAWIVGPNASDLISTISLAMQKGLKISDIEHVIYAHPTTAESIMEAVYGAAGKAIHTI